MSLDLSVNGASILLGVPPSSVEITQIADMGEPGHGKFVIEDDTGSLTVVGHQLATISESACTQPRLFTGWAAQRNFQRDKENAEIVDGARTTAVSIADMNVCLGFRLITGADGKRPDETWIERLRWILGSVYLSAWVSASEAHITASVLPMDDTDYRGQYAAAVLADLAERTGGTYNYFCYWDTTALEVRLFFEYETGTTGLSPLRISNVLSDRDGITTFEPDAAATLSREPDQVYSDVTVEYSHGTLKLHRSRPSTYATFVRRGTSISRPYIGKASTAESAAEKWLDKHATETDRITCSIQVPSSAAGLVQAGQSIVARFSHMPGYETGTTMRIVSCSPKPTNDVADFYDIALELVGSPPSPDCDTNALAGIVPTGRNNGAPFLLTTPEKTTDGKFDDINNHHGGFDPGMLLGPGTYVREMIWTLPGEIVIRKITLTAGLRGIGGVGQLDAAGDVVRSRFSIVVNGVDYVGTDYATPGDDDIWDWSEAIPGADPESVATWDLGSDIATDEIVLKDTLVWGGGIEYYHALDLAEIATCDLGGGVHDEIVPLPPAPGSTTTHTTDPTVDDDSAAGYTVGSTWINTTDGGVFVLVDSTTGAAVWVETSGGGTGAGAGQLGACFDGGNSMLVAPKYQDVVAPKAGTLSGWKVYAQQTGSIVFTVSKCTDAAFDTFTNVTGAASPSLSSSNKAASAGMAGWTTAVVAGDVFRFNLATVSGIRQVVVLLEYA